MLVQLRAGFVLVEQGKLEFLHLLEVVVQHELLGEGWVEVVDGCLCSVILAERHGNGRQSHGGQVPSLASACQPCYGTPPASAHSHEPQLTEEDTKALRCYVRGRQVQDPSPVLIPGTSLLTLQSLSVPRDKGQSSGHSPDG